MTPGVAENVGQSSREKIPIRGNGKSLGNHHFSRLPRALPIDRDLKDAS
jgi:hypothetical protein